MPVNALGDMVQLFSNTFHPVCVRSMKKKRKEERKRQKKEGGGTGGGMFMGAGTQAGAHSYLLHLRQTLYKTEGRRSGWTFWPGVAVAVRQGSVKEDRQGTGRTGRAAWPFTGILLLLLPQYSVAVWDLILIYMCALFLLCAMPS